MSGASKHSGEHVGRQQGSEVAFSKRVRSLRAQDGHLILCGISEEPTSYKHPVLRALLLCPTSLSTRTEDESCLQTPPKQSRIQNAEALGSLTCRQVPLPALCHCPFL